MYYKNRKEFIHMTKHEFVQKLAKKSDLSEKKVDEFIGIFTDEVAEIMKNGESISLQKFGKFSAATVAERDGRNPQTGDTVKIAAHKRPTFTAAKALKETINA